MTGTGELELSLTKTLTVEFEVANSVDVGAEAELANDSNMVFCVNWCRSKNNQSFQNYGHLTLNQYEKYKANNDNTHSDAQQKLLLHFL